MATNEREPINKIAQRYQCPRCRGNACTCSPQSPQFLVRDTPEAGVPGRVGLRPDQVYALPVAALGNDRESRIKRTEIFDGWLEVLDDFELVAMRDGITEELRQRGTEREMNTRE